MNSFVTTSTPQRSTTPSDTHCNAEPYAPPKELTLVATLAQEWRSIQCRLVFSLYAIIASEAAFSVFFPDSTTRYYVCWIAFAATSTTWAANDFQHRGGVFQLSLRMLFLLFCPISVVIYLVCTRKFCGIAMAVLHAIAMIVVARLTFCFLVLVLYFIGFLSVYDVLYLLT